MGRIVTTSVGTKKGKSRTAATYATTDHIRINLSSFKQGVLVHLERGAADNKADQSPGRNDTTEENTNVTSKINQVKLKLVKDLRATDLIRCAVYNVAPDDRNAVPYWKAKVKQTRITDELTIDYQLLNRRISEANLGAVQSS